MGNLISSRAVINNKVLSNRRDKKYKGKMTGNMSEKLLIEIYCSHNYKRCLKEVNKKFENYKCSRKILSTALCCIILQNSSQQLSNEFISKLKRNELLEYVYAYNFFNNNANNKCNTALIEDICCSLLYSRDINCIKLIRRALKTLEDINKIKIVKAAYKERFYYFAEEIIIINCKEKKNDFDLIYILSRIYYKCRDYKKCEECSLQALSIKNSKQLRRIYCKCKLISARETLCSYNLKCEDADFIMAIEKINEVIGLL